MTQQPLQTVFVYPGQGAQHVGMGRDLCARHPQAAARFAEADRRLGFELSRICFEGPPEALNSDLNAQLAVYVHSCAVSDVLRQARIRPDGAIGYSSGFYAAAYGCGCFDFAEGLEIVHRAGTALLREETERLDGAMAVIFGLTAAEVEKLCAEVGGTVLAIYNTPSQQIASGPREALGVLMERARAAGALDVYRLEAATAYHSPHMAAAGRRLRQALQGQRFRVPAHRLFSYATLEPVVERSELGPVMARQLREPVRWTQLVRKLRGQGMTTAVEVGPGAVLSRTLRWIDRQVQTLTTDRLKDVDALASRLAGREPSAREG